jgi:hypothetical protein
VSTLLSTSEIATAASRLKIAPAAARQLELLTRSIHAAGPAGFATAGLALDGATALLGVYLARHGVLRVPVALELAAYRAGASLDRFLAVAAPPLDAEVRDSSLVFTSEGETFVLPVTLARSPLRFAPPREVAHLPGAVEGAITAGPLHFALHPTANPPGAVPVAYLEELVFRLLGRLAAAEGPFDAAAADDLAWLLAREPVETERATAGLVLDAFRRGLAGRGLDLADALPALRARILYALGSADRTKAAPAGWRLDAGATPADRVATEQAALRALRFFGETQP